MPSHVVTEQLQAIPQRFPLQLANMLVVQAAWV